MLLYALFCSNDHTVVWDIMNNHCVGSNSYVTADLYITNDFGSSSDIAVVTDGWSPQARRINKSDRSYSDMLKNDAVAPNAATP